MRTHPNDTKGVSKPPASSLKEGEEAERKCILSGKHAARNDLIRLVLGPDGQVAPDIRVKAPGRGAWIGVNRKVIDAAQAKGRLKSVLTKAFKTNDILVPDNLGERIETALRQTVLDRLGLEARAGLLLTGSEKIEIAARRGEVWLLLHAMDAGVDGRRKLDQAWRMGGGGPQGLVFPVERPILSLALGRQNVVHIAIIDHAAAKRVECALKRWCAFIDLDDGLTATTAKTPDVSAMNMNEGLE